MAHHTNLRRIASIAVAATSLLLSGCLFTPGKFTSELQLSKGGSFTYSYDGEISMMSLSKMAQMGAASTFEPACTDDETFEPRDCTRSEVDAQKEEWDAKQAREEQEKKQFAQMFGGLDVTDPESAGQLADILRKQKGWRKVDYLGDGLFVVSFAVSGNLSHGFQFPVVERMPGIASFIAILPRSDGSVRVDAPGFGGEAMPGMGPGMGMLAALGASGNEGEETPQMVTPNGILTIVTNGRIRANNTDEGPSDLPDGRQRLQWKVDAASRTAPMALIDLN